MKAILLLLILVAVTLLSTGCTTVGARLEPHQGKAYPAVRSLGAYWSALGGTSNLDPNFGLGVLMLLGADVATAATVDTLLLPYDVWYKPGLVNPNSRFGTYEGIYTLAPYSSWFRPNGIDEHWKLSGNLVELEKLRVAATAARPIENNRQLSVKLEGHLSERRKFSFLRADCRELRVSEVREMKELHPTNDGESNGPLE